jgi:hypothetical protein
VKFLYFVIIGYFTQMGEVAGRELLNTEVLAIIVTGFN